MPSISDPLFAALSDYRKVKSKELNRKHYHVFTNKALQGICNTIPTTLNELLSVKGIGPKIMADYGEDILEIVEEYGDVNERKVIPEDVVSKKGRKSSSSPSSSPSGGAMYVQSQMTKVVKVDQVSDSLLKKWRASKRFPLSISSSA